MIWKRKKQNNVNVSQSQLSFNRAQDSLNTLSKLTDSNDILRFIATQLIYIRQTLENNATTKF